MLSDSLSDYFSDSDSAGDAERADAVELGFDELDRLEDEASEAEDWTALSVGEWLVKHGAGEYAESVTAVFEEANNISQVAEWIVEGPHELVDAFDMDDALATTLWQLFEANRSSAKQANVPEPQPEPEPKAVSAAALPGHEQPEEVDEEFEAMDQLAQLEEQQREMEEETSSSGTELDMLASLEQGASPYVLTVACGSLRPDEIGTHRAPILGPTQT